MAAISTIIAAGALAVGTVSAVSSIASRQEAKEANQQAAKTQRQVQEENRAANAQSAAMERRQQLREARVRQAKILQAAENTGVEYSSGESGALAGLSTTLGANLGYNSSRAGIGDRVSALSQTAADFQLAAQNAEANARTGDSLFSLSGSLFSAAGGVNTIKTAYNKATA